MKRVLFLALIVIAYQMMGCTPNTKEAPDPLVVGFRNQERRVAGGKSILNQLSLRLKKKITKFSTEMAT